MKAREYRELSDEELKGKVAELRDQLFKLRFQHSLGQLENPVKLKNIKRDIARIETIIKESAAAAQRTK
ncbi:MAG: 50S ribosomal protein L29 [Candidatus Aminicenantes bacterium RBG_13_63_10]|nr:MAG: 50S ribosomal protein L29 [Candidatus Aminicenantes bacterium RBG_13_63_10]